MASSQINLRDYYFAKGIICGDSDVGKSSLLTRLQYDKFNEMSHNSLGLDCEKITFENHNIKLKLTIYDFPGEESQRYRYSYLSIFSRVTIIIICYDITNVLTFTNVKIWLEYVHKFSEKTHILVLCGTKSDLILERKVSEEEGRQFAKLNNMTFIETSAKSGVNVSELIKISALNIIDKKIYEIPTIKNGGIPICYGYRPRKQKVCNIM